MAFKDIRHLHNNNLQTLWRQPLAEISGALGDLGTLLPLMIALALQSSISLSSTLVFSGLSNVATGVVFGIPLPVQPMKAIAAAAVASRASLGETAAAGGLVSVAVLVLAATGLLRWAVGYIPVPVVKGIQLGAGLSLVVSAGQNLVRPLGWTTPVLDNRLWAAAALVGLMLSLRSGGRVPYALVAFVLGLAIAVVTILGGEGQHRRRLPGVALWRPSPILPAWLSPDALSMAVAQLPLTTLNSVIAVSALAADLLPQLPTPSVTELGLSVAAMNLAGCWFGAMPVCHGAGGLAAQHAFGARSGASVILLGLLKLVVGLLFGETLLDLLSRFPRALLGVMVLAAGLELAGVGQSLNHGASDLWEVEVSSSGEEGLAAHQHHRRLHRSLSEEERKERWSVMMMTAAGILAFRNDGVGFAMGMLCHWTYRVADRWRHGSGGLHGLLGGRGEGAPLLS